MERQPVVDLALQARTPEALELARAEAHLAPCDVRAAMKIVMVMIEALPVPEDANAAGFVAAFRLVVRRYPLWAIEEAAEAFIGGLVASHVSWACPNTAEFGRELERRVAEARIRLDRAKRRAEERFALDAEPQRTPRSPELKAKGDAAIARLRHLGEQDRLERMAGRRRET